MTHERRRASHQRVLKTKPAERATSRQRRRSASKPNRNGFQLPVEAIRVGQRVRRDLGDIDALAQSIADIGLLNPITVDENGHLLAGARRLAACKRLGLKTIEVRIVRCGA